MTATSGATEARARPLATNAGPAATVVLAQAATAADPSELRAPKAGLAPPEASSTVTVVLAQAATAADPSELRAPKAGLALRPASRSRNLRRLQPPAAILTPTGRSRRA
jgi:hypothetical protein